MGIDWPPVCVKRAAMRFCEAESTGVMLLVSLTNLAMRSGRDAMEGPSAIKGRAPLRPSIASDIYWQLNMRKRVPLAEPHVVCCQPAATREGTHLETTGSARAHGMHVVHNSCVLGWPLPDAPVAIFHQLLATGSPDNPAKRLESTLIHAGPSVTITSIANAGCFLVASAVSIALAQALRLGALGQRSMGNGVPCVSYSRLPAPDSRR